MLDFFQLQTNPFSDSVNPDFYYETDQHETVYLRMITAIEQDVSLALVSGRSGTGKTLLSQVLLKNLDPDRYVPVLVLATPNMPKTAFLQEIVLELGIHPEPEKRLQASTLLGLLSDYMIGLYHENRKLVLLVDECHFLPAETIHTLRSLSNIEVPQKKLLTCILLSEPRILKRLQNPNYEAVRGRIYMQASLDSLGEKDTEEYVKLRLLLAGGSDALFDNMALQAVQICSAGVPRLINKVCSCAMLEAFVQKASVITSVHVGMGAGQCMDAIKSGLRTQK